MSVFYQKAKTDKDQFDLLLICHVLLWSKAADQSVRATRVLPCNLTSKVIYNSKKDYNL